MWGGWFNGSWLAILDDLWFLWSVLANSIWIALIYKLTSKKFIQIIGLILGFVWVMLFPNMMLNLYMYPYFVIGFLFNKYENCIIKKKYIKNLRYVSILLFPLMMVFYRKEHFIYVSGMFNVGGSIVDALKIDLYRYAIGLIGSIFVFSVVWWLKIIKESRFAKMLEKLGGMTLEIYCLNLLFVSGWMPLLANYIISVTGISYASTYTIIWDLCISLIVAIVMILIMMGVIVLLKKSKIGGVLFGR